MKEINAYSFLAIGKTNESTDAQEFSKYIGYANNRDQSKYRVITGAETLGELMDAINSNENVYKMVGNAWVNNTQPIDISGLTFTEGITKTQLLSRESALPTNVQFKGQTTNNLVMLLTNTTKQIRSGAGDRKDAYRLVKELGLRARISLISETSPLK